MIRLTPKNVFFWTKKGFEVAEIQVFPIFLAGKVLTKITEFSTCLPVDQVIKYQTIVFKAYVEPVTVYRTPFDFIIFYLLAMIFWT